ncbi:hypothetical protein KCP69_08410 [Salmonella enterica subsp. enterica]|nr:hypothetical protein KCP69_08410 [Salmonella enterica subsp. enterica]
MAAANTGKPDDKIAKRLKMNCSASRCAAAYASRELTGGDEEKCCPSGAIKSR